jgi:hypothetical protein
MVQQQQTWRIIVQQHSNGIVILQSHHDVEDDKIEQYQEQFDQFYLTWLETTKCEGKAKYPHGGGRAHNVLFEAPQKRISSVSKVRKWWGQGT